MYQVSTLDFLNFKYSKSLSYVIGASRKKNHHTHVNLYMYYIQYVCMAELPFHRTTSISLS